MNILLAGNPGIGKSQMYLNAWRIVQIKEKFSNRYIFVNYGRSYRTCEFEFIELSEKEAKIIRIPQILFNL